MPPTPHPSQDLVEWSFHRQRNAASQNQSSARQGSKVRGE